MKKGFTLIELLAVIVILAIIALIATPLVLKYIEKSRDDSRLRSAENYVNAVEKAVVNQNMKGEKFNPNTCTVTDKKLYCDGTLLEVNIKGVKPDDGSYITFNNGKIEDVKLLYDDKIIVNDENNKLVYGDNIELLEPGLYDDNNKLLASWDELVDKYGLDIETNYTASNYKTSNTMYSVLSNNANLSSGTKVIIKDGVTKIGNMFFRDCENLKVIKLPETIISIGTAAFMENKSLKELRIPDSVTSIGSSTFYNCENLEEVNIPDGITEIGTFMFYSCEKIKKIELPLTIKKIGSSSFVGCYNLEEINIPASVTTINSNAFRSCRKLKKLEIPSSVTSIASPICSGCESLEKLTVDTQNTKYNDGNGLNVIIETATNKIIAGSKNVTAIPDGVKIIADSAFENLKLKNITIPESVTEIKKYAFLGNDFTSFVIPDSVTTIGFGVFEDNINLKKLVIPKNVSSIGNSIVRGCDSLEEIIVDADNTFYDSREGSNSIIKTSSNQLIAGCKTTVIPSSVVSIGDYAFSTQNNLVNVTIPSGVTSIGQYAFGSCKNLQTITISETVTSIDEAAFLASQNLKTIYYKGTATGAPWGATNATVISNY